MQEIVECVTDAAWGTTSEEALKLQKGTENWFRKIQRLQMLTEARVEDENRRDVGMKLKYIAGQIKVAHVNGHARAARA